MLQATIYAHRSAHDGLELSGTQDHPPIPARGNALGRLLSIGKRLIGGEPDAVLSDHVLDDIGLSRADLDALSL